jgi:hypothetical protein
MAIEGVTTHPTVPSLLAFAERLHAAGDEALGELLSRLVDERDDVRAARPGRCWHEVGALLDTVIRVAESEIERRRPAA